MKIETVILCFEFLIPSLLHTTSAKVTNASLFQGYQLASFNSCVKNVDSTWENEWLAFTVSRIQEGTKFSDPWKN